MLDNESSETEPIKVTVQINGANLEMEVDTGAASSVIMQCCNFPATVAKRSGSITVSDREEALHLHKRATENQRGYNSHCALPAPDS